MSSNAFAIWMIFAACTRSEDRKHDEVAVELAPGTIRGTATASAVSGVPTVSGDSPQTEPCEIVATSKSGVPTRTRSNARGEYELKVAPGSYEVSFAACIPRNCMAPANTQQQITVTTGAVSTASWHCSGANP